MAGPPQPKVPRPRRPRKSLRARRIVDVHLLTDEERATVTPRDLRAQEVYDAGQTAVTRDRYRCAGAGLVPHDCTALRHVDPHHLIPRSVRPDLAADPENIVPVCRTLHRWIDANPAAAAALGLHGYSWDNPSDLADRRTGHR